MLDQYLVADNDVDVQMEPVEVSFVIVDHLDGGHVYCCNDIVLLVCVVDCYVFVLYVDTIEQPD